MVTCSPTNWIYTSINLSFLDKVAPNVFFTTGIFGSAFPGYLICILYLSIYYETLKKQDFIIKYVCFDIT